MAEYEGVDGLDFDGINVKVYMDAMARDTAGDEELVLVHTTVFPDGLVGHLPDDGAVVIWCWSRDVGDIPLPAVLLEVKAVRQALGRTFCFPRVVRGKLVLQYTARTEEERRLVESEVEKARVAVGHYLRIKFGRRRARASC